MTEGEKKKSERAREMKGAANVICTYECTFVLKQT